MLTDPVSLDADTVRLVRWLHYSTEATTRVRIKSKDIVERTSTCIKEGAVSVIIMRRRKYPSHW